jgi:hypothetical protein
MPKKRVLPKSYCCRKAVLRSQKNGRLIWVALEPNQMCGAGRQKKGPHHLGKSGSNTGSGSLFLEVLTFYRKHCYRKGSGGTIYYFLAFLFSEPGLNVMRRRGTSK